MISVTVAANGRTRRYVGAHLKAYGSGRLSIAELDYDPSNVKRPQKSGWSRFLWKFIHIMVQIFKSCFPFFSSSKERKLYRKLTTRTPPPVQLPSPIRKINKNILLNIFKHLDGASVKNCAGVNRTWRKIIMRNREDLPKVELDMIHIVFDEGNVVLHSRDTKMSPVRYTLPPLRLLEVYLRHINADSLMVRGLIPVESTLVLTSLLKMKLTPNQMYFIWCTFHEDSIPMLHGLLTRTGMLCDVGMEGCGPAALLDDDLFKNIIPDLKSIRIYNDAGAGFHSLGDKTINRFAESIKKGKTVDTIHLVSCHVSFAALRNLIVIWIQHATGDISVSIGNSTQLGEHNLAERLLHEEIIVEEDGYIQSGPFRMSIFC